MSSFCSTLVAAATAFNPTIFTTKDVSVQVADHPLAPNALELTGNRENAYGYLNQIIEVWERKGITDYLILSQTGKNEQIVPFTKQSFRFFQQLRVLWNLTFGGWKLSEATQKITLDNFWNRTQKVDAIREKIPGKDAFCDEAVIQKQLI